MFKIPHASIIIIIQICVLNYVEGNPTLNGLNNSYNNDCRNPNGQAGVCISLHYCPTLLRTFLNPPNRTDIEDQQFLQQSSCLNGFGPNQFVCCTNEVTFRNKSSATTELINSSLLASPDECTGPHTIYQYGTQLADIRDYHWQAVLEFKIDGKLNEFTPRCQGSLISHKYVLTANHCMHGTSAESVRVMLGEYDLSTDIDCVDDFCLGSPIYVDVEKIILHSEYNNKIFQNDIALLRLAKYVAYDESISPICLPSVVGFNGSRTGEGLFLAGFDSSNQITKKVQVNQPIFDQNNCTEIYKIEEITRNQLCAGGNAEGDDLADSGGALMKRFQGKWIIEGIVSFGLKYPMRGIPTVYTRVSEFENWIIQNIEQ